MAGHSYEELRGIALDILAGREKTACSPDQYGNLVIGVDEVLARRGGQAVTQSRHGRIPAQSPEVRQIMLEVFWNLFRDGTITLGLNDSNREFPFFHLSRSGKQLVESKQAPYFFHDTSTYEAAIRGAVPKINETTLLYLKEAMQAFHAGCILSCSVMIGVATEHSFLLLAEDAEASSAHGKGFDKVGKERTILQKFNKFKSALDGLRPSLAPEIRESLDTNFVAILDVIRTFRNDAGHPTGTIISREQAYVLLQLFVPYAKKIYQLRDFFAM